MPTDQDFTLVNVGDLRDSGSDFASALMTDTCKIGRLVGGVWTLEHSGIACRLALNTANVRFVSPLGSAVSLIWEISVPLGTDILTLDQVYCNGQLFVVDDADAGMTGATCIRAYMRRVYDGSLNWFV